MAAWEAHAESCGAPLPTEERLRSATADEAVASLREFGDGFPMLADAALHRIVEYAEAASGWDDEDRMRLVRNFEAAGGFEGVVGLLMSRPRDLSLQARGCYALSGMCEGESGCMRAVDAGVFQVITTALSNFGHEVEVLHWGATAVLRLTHDSATRAHLAIAAGAEKALKKPVSNKVFKRELPEIVTTKIELAQRWLAMHAKLLIDARGRVLLGDTALEQVMSGSR